MQYRSKMVERKSVAGQLMLLRLEKPGGFDFVAGQFSMVTAPDIGLRDAEGLRKPLSIATSPLESSLLYTVRLTGSAFKRTFAEMPEGSPVEVESPLGFFTLPRETDTPLIFLAGGMGVAPFRSMMRYASDAATGHRITLFYSSRVPEEALFLDEFQEIAARLPNISVVATMTRPEQSALKWQGPTGRLTPQAIKDGCPDWPTATYYLSGPPVMVEAMKTMLGEMEIRKERIKQEVWTGY